jgi:hypothetical protein
MGEQAKRTMHDGTVDGGKLGERDKGEQWDKGTLDKGTMDK